MVPWLITRPELSDQLVVEPIEPMCQILQIALPNPRGYGDSLDAKEALLFRVLSILRGQGEPLKIADYLLVNLSGSRASVFEGLLENSIGEKG